ncbi:Rrf2 family transcriptional regulator [Paenibacillus sp. F6_3S_P_1C]|uniref:Rrf2 family transcriptional regulator n=1 Tax=Paenibacillus vandeheii TaxID=3035917 RepID=A0ABT8JHG6_9BACL|nr:Rrf2 family transcriptional regulator [Paenibacillus vandeheii]MDN4604273.1 Rrf2 family transcriptional regulator [Paenibacillus vandeheii]
MKFTSGVEQAAAIVVLLASQDLKSPLASDEISRILEVSPSYIKKLTRRMVIKGIINSVSGTKGGITLAKSKNELTVLDLIEAIEGPINVYQSTGLIQNSFKDGLYAEKGSEVISSMFEGANQLLVQYFSSITIADLLKQSTGGSDLPKIDWNTMSLAHFLNKK